MRNTIALLCFMLFASEVLAQISGGLPPITQKKAVEEHAAKALRKAEEAKREAERLTQAQAGERARVESERMKKESVDKAKAEAEEKVKADAAHKAEEARSQAQKSGPVFRDCPDCPQMVAIPAGSFVMGSPASEDGRVDREGPQRHVRVSRPFAAGRYEVTFDEWDACAREAGCTHNPGDAGWGRGQRPVINVSWSDAKQFTEWLSRKTGQRYRLLTEAEWEYAARAGTTTAYSTGATIAASQANFGRSWYQTAPAGNYGPNAFGLYDVHGNVWEWTEDCANASYAGAPSDDSAWQSVACSHRVGRGGGWDSVPRSVRSANRGRGAADYRSSNSGFRLARTLE